MRTLFNMGKVPELTKLAWGTKSLPSAEEGTQRLSKPRMAGQGFGVSVWRSPSYHTPGWAAYQMFILKHVVSFTQTGSHEEHWSLRGLLRLLPPLWGTEPHQSVACLTLLQRGLQLPDMVLRCPVGCSTNSRLLEQDGSGVSPLDPSAPWGPVSEAQSVLHPGHECSELQCHQTHNAVGQGPTMQWGRDRICWLSRSYYRQS